MKFFKKKKKTMHKKIKYGLLVTAGWIPRCLGTYTTVLSNSSFMSILMSLFKAGFVLRCFQHLSLRAWLLGIPCQITDRLEAPKASSSRTIASFLSDTKTYPVDIKQTVSQRSEPSSRSLLMGEHPHPWALLHAQVRKSRHRCSKPRRRFELSGATALLSPE